MKRKAVAPFVYFGLFLCTVLSLSDAFVHKVRFFAVSSLAPSSSSLAKVKDMLVKETHDDQSPLNPNLVRENQALKEQIHHLREWIVQEDRIEEQISRIGELGLEKSDLVNRRKQQLSNLLSLQSKACIARVVYRDPSSWSSFIWIDRGSKKALDGQPTLIDKNSPVVVGNTLVGVVEEVGETLSKVRLVTDSNLFPSVRVARGQEQDELFLKQLQGTFNLLQTRSDLFGSKEDKKVFLNYMLTLIERLQASDATAYLAKGELKGCSHPLWRVRGQKLKGLGFNYEFSDEMGPARDLRSSEITSDRGQKKRYLIREGDLLVTTGLDGVFPPGLEVAVVSQVHRLKEGSSSYELEATSLAENTSSLRTVFVLPPLY